MSKVVTTKAIEAKLKAKYPAAYYWLTKENKDLARWVIDNIPPLIKQLEEKQSHLKPKNNK